MSKFHSGVYYPKNPEKLIGEYPHYRSSWELAFLRVLDENPFVIKYAYEAVKIPYKNPLTERYTNYIPDFLVVWMDKSGKMNSEIIEIKPLKERLLEKAKSKKNQMAYYVNRAKWAAAVEYCSKNGLKFRVMSENDLFRH